MSGMSANKLSQNISLRLSEVCRNIGHFLSAARGVKRLARELVDESLDELVDELESRLILFFAYSVTGATV